MEPKACAARSHSHITSSYSKKPRSRPTASLVIRSSQHAARPWLECPLIRETKQLRSTAHRVNKWTTSQRSALQPIFSPQAPADGPVLAPWPWPLPEPAPRRDLAFRHCAFERLVGPASGRARARGRPLQRLRASLTPWAANTGSPRRGQSHPRLDLSEAGGWHELAIVRSGLHSRMLTNCHSPPASNSVRMRRSCT